MNGTNILRTIGRRIARSPELLLPPAYYIIKDRYFTRFNNSAASKSNFGVNSKSYQSVSKCQASILEYLCQQGSIDYLIGEKFSGSLLRDFCKKLASEDGATKINNFYSSQNIKIVSNLAKEGYCSSNGYFPRALIDKIGKKIKEDYHDKKSDLWKHLDLDKQGKTVPVQVGDVIFADVRGIHSGSYLHSGVRFQLVAQINNLVHNNQYDPMKRFIRNSQ